MPLCSTAISDHLPSSETLYPSLGFPDLSACFSLILLGNSEGLQRETLQVVCRS